MGGLDLIDVAFSIYVRGDTRASPAITSVANSELSEINVKSAVSAQDGPYQNLNFYPNLTLAYSD